MATALFVSESYLKESTFIDENVDMKILTPVIEEAQESHLLPILGTALYNTMVTRVTAGTVTGNYQTLMNSYIQPALKWWILFEGIDVLSYKFMNKNIFRRTSDQGESVGVDELKRLMERFRDKAEWYSERLTKYLIANTTLFTDYNNPGSTSDTIHPIKDNFFSGMWLGNNNYNKSRRDCLEDNDCEDC